MGNKGPSIKPRCNETIRAQTHCQTIKCIVDEVHVNDNVGHNLAYSYTECCFMKYVTNFHTQSFVGRAYSACVALEHTMPAGSGFSTKCLFGKRLLTFLPGLPDTGYGDSMFFQNFGVYLPTNMASDFEFLV